MSIQRKILLYQVLVAAVLLSVAAATYIAIERMDYYFTRSSLARQQMEAAVTLSAHMNRYSENIAELILLGRAELDDFYAARDNVEQSLSQLTRLVGREIAVIRSAAERKKGELELEHAEAMRGLFETINRTTEHLLFLRDQGRQEEATRLFRDRIEDRLDAQFKEQVAAAILEKRREITLIDDRTESLEKQVAWLVFGVTLAGLIVSSAAGALLTRRLTRRIRELISGTRAIGEGDLSYRIGHEGDDELADLARQFDLTATRLETQRAELLQVQAGLEDEIGRRTAEIEEANAHLQRVDKARVLFLADISHELRTPLTVLRGEAEVSLRGDKPVEEHRDTLRRIVLLAQQMGALVDDLLFLAKAEVGAVRFMMQPLDLQDVVEGALLEARVLAETEGLSVRSRTVPNPCPVEGDAQRLRQALLVLLDNAIKYSDPSENVDVSLDCSEDEAIIAVRNVGVGIPSQELPFVFDRFYRGKQAPNRQAAGSGLGLPIAKWVIDKHGGRVDLASRNRETVVRVHLPLRREPYGKAPPGRGRSSDRQLH